MKFKLLNTFILTLGLFSTSMMAQDDKASLVAQKAQLAGEIAKLNGELSGVEAKLSALPGWTKGYAGLIGFSLTKLNNWRQNPRPYSNTNTISLTGSSFAHLIQDKYFWRNNANLALGWQKLQANAVKKEDTSKYISNVDVLNISSLYGYKLTKTIAASALAEFRTSIINNAFNPAYLDMGIGATWTPIPELVVVFHPLNYNYIFSKNDTKFVSSLGCKIVADYEKAIFKNTKFKTNLSAFVSYKDPSDLSNLTWTSGLNFSLYKGLGVGLNYAYRWNKQETKGASSDNQSYIFAGISYAL